MENNLFEIVPQGYDCEKVNEYITTLREEYRKVFEYAKSVEEKNNKFKVIYQKITEENKQLKAQGGVVVTTSNESGTDFSSLIDLSERLSLISEELKNTLANLG